MQRVNPVTQCPQLPLALLMRRLEERKVALTAEGDELRYHAPIGTLSAIDKQELASRRDEVIGYVRAQRATKKPPFEAHPRSPTASFTQRLWWKGIQEAGSQPGDCLWLTVAFSEVSERIAEAAIRRVITRHDALRYRLTDAHGTLVAALNAAEEFAFDTAPIVTRSTGPQATLGLITRFDSTTIPIDGSWLTVAKVTMTDEREGVIALGVNHIIADATSLLIIRDELKASLACGAHADCERDAPPIQFSRYAAWEAAWFQGEAASSLAAYWAHWIAHVPALRLPQTGVPLAWAPGNCVAYQWTCGASGSDSVRQLAARYLATPFAVLLSVFAIALFRWSGQPGFGVLSVADGRAYGEPSELESMVGPMVHMDPIEVTLRGDSSLPLVLRDIHSSYESARRLRFPLNDSQPGVTEREFHHRIAASINYVSLVTQSQPGRHHPPLQTLEPSPRSVVSAKTQHTFHALQPINLRVIHEDGNLRGLLEFNEAVIPEHSQDVLLTAFLETLRDAFRSGLGR
jgi:hypothetical protein